MGRAGKPEYILAIDEGTTGVTVQIFGRRGEVASAAYREFRQYFPRPGWVEHDAAEIWRLTCRNIEEALQKGKIKPDQIASIGITNQRETFVLWERENGKPVGKAIVWQCRRSSELCEKLKKQKMEPWLQEKTGLRLDPYFSLTKLKMQLDQHPELVKKARNREILFGTIDTWLLWNLTGGVAHATDWTNASRTLMLNLVSRGWDEEILNEFKIPSEFLPRLHPSIGVFGFTQGLKILPDGIPIGGMAGDQQAALFGQRCIDAGQAKNTYGTGCFLLMHTGRKPVRSQQGLITTVAASDIGTKAYALEGSIFIAGAAVQWLRDGLKFFSRSRESERLAKSVTDSHGVFMIPAFVGLGAPHWRSDVRGALFGLTRGTTREHIVRATLESIAFQTRTVADLIQQESGIQIKELRVDGKVTENNFLMQFQADLLGIPILRPENKDTTVKGAALLAGLGSGFWRSEKDFARMEKIERVFRPQKKNETERLYQGWQRTLETLCAGGLR